MTSSGHFQVTLLLTVVIFIHRCDDVDHTLHDDVTEPVRSDVIRTTSGDVRGMRKRVLGRDVEVYWGMPYAKRPERFQRAQTIGSWEGVLDAATPPPTCPGVPYPGGLIPLVPLSMTRFDEDCLYLNLWVPKGCELDHGNDREDDDTVTEKAGDHNHNVASHDIENNEDDVSEDARDFNDDDDDNNDDGEGLAIMVWIHGGAFEWGSGSTTPTYDGQVLASTQCVIVASINYRLGPLGFLSLGGKQEHIPGNVDSRHIPGNVDTGHAPGNLGLLDQVLALTWIRENAANFGGSAKRITVFGESAGALSAAAHMVSPLSRNLFSNAILMSGPPTARWGQRTRQQNANNARKLARLVSCSNNNKKNNKNTSGVGKDDDDDDEDGDDSDDKAILNCLKKVDALELGRAALNLTLKNPGFGLIVDGLFLTEPIPDSFKDPPKPFPLMMGVTKNDGSFIYSLATQERIQDHPTEMSYEEFRKVLTDFVLPYFAYKPLRPEHLTLILDLVESMYVNKCGSVHSMPECIDNQHKEFQFDSDHQQIPFRLVVDDMLRDLSFLCPMYTTLAPFLGRKSQTPFLGKNQNSKETLLRKQKEHCLSKDQKREDTFLGQKNGVFLYSFDHRSSNTLFPPWMGVVHAAELDFVFGRPLDTADRFTDRERRLSSTVMTAWANFAKTGNPNKGAATLPNTWPSVTADLYPHAILGGSVEEDVAVRWDKLRGCPYCYFWNEFYPTFIASLEKRGGSGPSEPL